MLRARIDMRVPLRRLAIFAALAVVLWLALACLYDAMIPLLSSPGCPRSRIVVIDVSGILKSADLGVPIVRGLTVPQLLSLGRCGARYIVIVGHGLEIESSVTGMEGGFALETSEPANVLALVKYPLFVFTEALMRGYVPGSSPRLAATSRITWFMASMRGKIVVLITCPLGDIKSFARSLIERGCIAVAYPSMRTLALGVLRVVVSVVKSLSESKSVPDAVHSLRELGFIVLQAERQ